MVSMEFIVSRLINRSCFKAIKLFMHTVLRNINNSTVVASSSRTEDSLMHHITLDRELAENMCLQLNGKINAPLHEDIFN